MEIMTALFNLPFFGELILGGALPVFLFLPHLLTTDETSFSEETVKKKQFFILLRVLQCVLVLVLLFDGCLLVGLQPVSDGILHFGNYFFRFDHSICVLNFVVTCLTLYFISLCLMLFVRTTTTVAYIVEVPFLILCTLLGLRLLIATNDFFLLVILLEIIAFCSVIFLGLQSTSAVSLSLSIEATIKYFIINALAVGVLLFGIAGYFYVTTASNVWDIWFFFQQYPHMLVFFIEQTCFSYLLVLSAFIIKVGGAPVHQWVPDVYEGAETIVTCFLVLVISPPFLIKLLQLTQGLGVVFSFGSGVVHAVSSAEQLTQGFFWLTGVLSILVGTAGAFYQTRIKRFIAYASLTHLGFMFLALVNFNMIGYFAVFAYLGLYVVTNLCFFTILLCGQYYFYSRQLRLVFINQLKPYVQGSVGVFFALMICLFSFAGIPPFGGFFAKFVTLSVLAASQYEKTLLFLFVAILVGTFMYLRFLKIAFFETLAQPVTYVTALSSQILFFLTTSNIVEPSRRGGWWSSPQQELGYWQERVLIILCFLVSLIAFFVFFLDLYFMGIFDVTLAFITH